MALFVPLSIYFAIAQPLHVTINTSVVATTSDHYLCWNIDASRNRQFFSRGERRVREVRKPHGDSDCTSPACQGNAHRVFGVTVVSFAAYVISEGTQFLICTFFSSVKKYICSAAPDTWPAGAGKVVSRAAPAYVSVCALSYPRAPLWYRP